MFRLALCEDNPFDKDLLMTMIRCYSEERHCLFTLTAYSRGADLLRDMQEGDSYDVIFLDIYLEDTLGIRVAQQLRKDGYRGKLIFLTGTDEFAVDSYEVEASNYLLKPHNYEKLAQALDRALQQSQVQQTYRIQKRSGSVYVLYDEILYIESSNNTCLIHAQQSGNPVEYILYKTLNTIEAELQDKRFLRCHQSFLVNMDKIRSADKAFELITGDLIPIRQRNLRAIREHYLSYLDQQKPGRYGLQLAAQHA